MLPFKVTVEVTGILRLQRALGPAMGIEPRGPASGGTWGPGGGPSPAHHDHDGRRIGRLAQPRMVAAAQPRAPAVPAAAGPSTMAASRLAFKLGGIQILPTGTNVRAAGPGRMHRSRRGHRQAGPNGPA
jgi:hypothetical protein